VRLYYLLVSVGLSQLCGKLPSDACENVYLIQPRSIFDEDGPKIADSFYKHLFREVPSATNDAIRPDTTQAARSLHYAVAKLRSENVSFARWLPFVHMGR
jgi:hypothetical protein